MKNEVLQTIQPNNLLKSMRKKRTAVKVGNIIVGGENPIVVQSMTNTPTDDIETTTKQVLDLARSGSELVRLTVNTNKAAQAIPVIKEKLLAEGVDVPLIGDFHFNGHKLLTDNPDCAQALAKYRINPGNVGRGEKHDTQFASMIEIACKYEKAVRIGVNWGSLDQELLAKMLLENEQLSSPTDNKTVMKRAVVRSAVESARFAESIGLPESSIILSCKMSHVQDLIEVYHDLAAQSNHALHLGLTEAGMGVKGVVATTAALSVILQQGIGDTIRVSLTPSPTGDRTEEVIVAQEILQSLDLRAFSPQVTSCPGCGRTNSADYLELADQIQTFIRIRSPEWRSKFPGVEKLSIAVMGCIVNGPGESKHADIGISLPGAGETEAAPVYVDGKKVATLKGSDIKQQFMNMIEDYIQQRFGDSAFKGCAE